MKRIFFDILLFLSVFVFPWWMSALLALLGVLLFKDFYEFLMVGIIIYILYAIPGKEIITSQIWYHVILISIFAGIQFIHHRTILYKNEI